MEPISVVALVGSGLAAVTKSIKNLKELLDKTENMKQITQLLIAKLSTLRAALSQLQIFLGTEGIHRIATPQLQSDLECAIHPCNTIINVIAQYISQVQSGWLDGRLRYLWDESIIREHGAHLDSQISALNLLLQVIQLSSANEQRALLERRRNRRILQRAQDDASSYLSASSLSASSSQRPVTVDLEHQLMNSSAYRNASERWDQQREGRRDDAPGSVHSTSKGAQTSLQEYFTEKAHEEVFEKQNSASTRIAKHWYRKKMWGRFPIWLAILSLSLLLLSVILVPAVVTFVVKNNQKSGSKHEGGNREDPAAVPGMTALSATLFDATPIPSPTSLAQLPTGSYSLPLGLAQNSNSGCLDPANNQSIAWSCKMTFTPLLITVNGTSDSPSAWVQPFTTPDRGLRYGVQPPNLSGPMQLVLDLDSKDNGPAYHISSRYDKVVLLQQDELIASASRKRDENDSMVSLGDIFWYCMWNQTYIEGYIYATANSTGATATAFPSAFASTTTSPSSSAEATSSPAIRHRSDGDYPRLPSYPRIAKIEEMRLPQSPQPYCQEKQLLDSGQIADSTDSSGNPIIVYLQEMDPSIEEFLGTIPTSSQLASSSPNQNVSKRRRRASEKRKVPSSACHCEWLFQ